MQVQEKEKMYIELRQILARQPGPELTEQLSEYKRAIKQKVKQLKTLTAELNMAESAQQAQDMDIQRLANELQVNLTRQRAKLLSGSIGHFLDKHKSFPFEVKKVTVVVQSSTKNDDGWKYSDSF